MLSPAKVCIPLYPPHSAKPFSAKRRLLFNSFDAAIINNSPTMTEVRKTEDASVTPKTPHQKEDSPKTPEASQPKVNAAVTPETQQGDALANPESDPQSSTPEPQDQGEAPVIPETPQQDDAVATPTTRQ